MSKVITAEYDEKHHSLKLDAPLAGVQDRAKLRVIVEDSHEPGKRPWTHLRGVLSKEGGDSLARAIKEAGFGLSDE